MSLGIGPFSPLSPWHEVNFFFFFLLLSRSPCRDHLVSPVKGLKEMVLLDHRLGNSEAVSQIHLSSLQVDFSKE